MGIDYIFKKVAQLMRKYNETDPFRLARLMHVVLCFESMGTSDSACKGFYIYQCRRHVITINSDMSEEDQRVVLIHELGHAVLHWQMAKLSPLREFSLYNGSSHMEYEANIFAAEFSLPDERVLALLNDNDNFFSTASELYVPPELLDFKFRILREKGYDIDSPITAYSDFLKHLTENRRA